MSMTSGENSEDSALADTLTAQPQPSPQQQETVPLHVVQAMREELKALKEKNEAFNNHLSMMQWNQQAQQAPQPQKNPWGDIDPDDSIKARDAMRMYGDLENKFNTQLAEIKMASRTPDYEEVVRKYLPRAAQEDPELLHEIKTSPNPYKTAYLAAKASKAYQEDMMSGYRQNLTSQQVQAKEPAPKAATEAEKVINNARQSGNLASVANNATSSGSHPDFSRMSDQEFMAYKSQVKFKRAGR